MVPCLPESMSLGRENNPKLTILSLPSRIPIIPDSNGLNDYSIEVGRTDDRGAPLSQQPMFIEGECVGWVGRREASSFRQNSLVPAS